MRALFVQKNTELQIFKLLLSLEKSDFLLKKNH